MKRTTVTVLLGLSLFFPPMGEAAEAVFPPGMPRDSYVDQAGQELRQVRVQVDATARRASESAQSRFAPVYDALAAAEQRLADLRAAESEDLARRRAEFDEAKAKAVGLWRNFRLSAEPSEPARN